MNASMFFLNGVVAKVTTGVTVVAISVGGLQAVEKYELQDKLQQVSVVEQDVDFDAPLEEQFPGDQEIVALAEEVDEPEAEVIDEGSEPKNHGQEVSEFVHETDLVGCEKGQAVAAKASENKDEDDDKDPCNKKDGEVEEEDENVDENVEADDAAEDDDGNRNGNGKGNAKKDK
ncbi:MAG: hypothetical protein HKN94_01105 [Acidimicrobiales bacterium]|nr:hypothetical protein [Acidimicrobiales bacterium]RZV47560.1 MAG: hypothetical protein EX269_04440 [Acidimicrobiales bacterium]